VDISIILTRRFPDASWSCNDNDYEQLSWNPAESKPSKKQLESLWPEVEIEIAVERVEKARAIAYRETADPLFFQYQRGEVAEQVWLDAVQAVKDAHPYPEA
jgi:hypothetical protein